MPIARADPGIHLRPLHGASPATGCGHQAGQPPRCRHHDRRAGFGEQLEKILSYVDIGRKEGAQLLAGGARNVFDGALKDGYYMQPTVFRGHNRMRIFQEEIFGPVLSVTTFKDEDEALAIANDTLYGLGAGVLDARRESRLPLRARYPGRPRVDQLLPPVSGPCGLRRYKQSGIGRETHRMMLDHYQQTKNMLVSYSPKALGFF